METKDFFLDKQRSANGQITLKVFIIGAIAIALLIPKFMILGLIHERQITAETTQKDVMQNWSLPQTVRGPVLSIPYTERHLNKAGEEIQEEIRTCYFLPETLNIESTVLPKKRKRSIYETVVFTSDIKITGRFEMPDFETLKISPKDVLWDKAKILLSVSDLRGINDNVSLLWNGKSFPFLPGMENLLVGQNGISLPLPLLPDDDFQGTFQINLNLKGSKSLNFAPLGETTEVTMQSEWNDPGFEGNFLPAEYTIDKNGFKARWKILNFNRNYPQEWKNDEYRVTGSDFGVKLVTMADHYQKSSRSAKYAILVILFTFLAFFLNEVITKQKVHPFQYILVGFSILIFYLLLLSVSEQLGFNLAYLISASAVVIMVFAYSRTFLKKWIHSAIQTLILTFSFGFIFVLMQLESYALLAGSIGLFCVLGLTMFFTRKIKWYND
ncbi:cell envelope integrity protein CreD [Mariniphaga sediminis]|jgi:inner membrane protein|uniref:Cell envelope integrity protein CreD n=1 Tax=Mariniphaga sediminis TaxID=1628158 RepID=A0A399CXK1_9BACT|nr:cell envelope integrity protein CreD [Mariniphaga sediminis]RIH63202.1 cell envelope integrity protein CreD [Mariniphaga sediminis]